MKSIKKKKIVLDLAVLICSVLFNLCFFYLNRKGMWIQIPIGAVSILALADVLVLVTPHHTKIRQSAAEYGTMSGASQLVLLDEKENPVKSWDLAGKKALIIGKKNEEEEIDVDLEDCEYSTFIDPQHAVLNFCLDSWYLEDLGSQNGVKIKKVEDGGCYQVTNRPCRLSAGDIIYIANTRLLLT
ncbi:FHA domain-containing protein [Lacrimispora sp. 38-1]|uniref:FHA domain-containing protein n=1 Tax=Lacrimispora sp. 38-1 TaxID=3125778 RepID=UPI003CEBD730